MNPEIPCPTCGVAMQHELTGATPKPGGGTVVDAYWYCAEDGCDSPYKRNPTNEPHPCTHDWHKGPWLGNIEKRWIVCVKCWVAGRVPWAMAEPFPDYSDGDAKAWENRWKNR